MVFIGCRDRIATPLYAFCVTATLSYPSDLKASNGNSVPFNSCSNNTSGSRAFSHAVTCVSRERTEFKFQLTTLNMNPHSSVMGGAPPLSTGRHRNRRLNLPMLYRLRAHGIVVGDVVDPHV